MKVESGREMKEKGGKTLGLVFKRISNSRGFLMPGSASGFQQSVLPFSFSAFLVLSAL